jgi:hypothetical protein
VASTSSIGMPQASETWICDIAPKFAGLSSPSSTALVKILHECNAQSAMVIVFLQIERWLDAIDRCDQIIVVGGEVEVELGRAEESARTSQPSF